MAMMAARALSAAGGGTRLQQRYEIVEWWKSEAGRARYRARDLSLCTSCGFEGNPG
jgi:hypothetical protein